MASSDTGLQNSWGSGGLWDMTRRVQVVTFIGAGGKTTCLHSITQELESLGKPVIATTTTKVFPEKHMSSWVSDDPPKSQDKACFWYAKVEDKSGKWIGPTVNAVDTAISDDLLSFKCRDNQESEQTRKASIDASSGTVPGLHTDASSSLSSVPDMHDLHLDQRKRYWVIEGDGARGLRLKCWEPHEPQIPLQSNCAVLVLDRRLWGKVLQPNQVHRPQRCSDLLGSVWNAESSWHYFLGSPVFSTLYRKLAWVILLNGPGEIIKTVNPMINQKASEDINILGELSQKWVEIQARANNLNRPTHLRLAVGDAKEGAIQWCDLW